MSMKSPIRSWRRCESDLFSDMCDTCRWRSQRCPQCHGHCCPSFVCAKRHRAPHLHRQRLPGPSGQLDHHWRRPGWQHCNLCCRDPQLQRHQHPSHNCWGRRRPGRGRRWVTLATHPHAWTADRLTLNVAAAFRVCTLLKGLSCGAPPVVLDRLCLHVMNFLTTSPETFPTSAMQIASTNHPHRDKATFLAVA